MNDIIVAPFSNSDIRDWPPAHYAELVRLLAARWKGEGLIRVIGTAAQRSRAYEVVRESDAARVFNDCGRLSWTAVLAHLRSAACVIGNNSGIAHLAAHHGVPTVCVFGGSHQRLEWRPLGSTVAVISRSIGCSPCQLDHGQTCPYGKPCLTEIQPAVVADAALAMMSKSSQDPQNRVDILSRPRHSGSELRRGPGE